MEYKKAYEFWIEQIIVTVSWDLKNNHYKGKEYSLLEGLAGVSLVLQSCITPGIFDWSRIRFL